MSERQPYHPPIPDQQHAPHEGGNDAAGLPRTLHESAKPPPLSKEAPAQGGRKSTRVQLTPAEILRSAFSRLEHYEKQERLRDSREQLKSDPAYQKAQREKRNARARERYRERKEEGTLPVRKRQLTQVFPDPPKE